MINMPLFSVPLLEGSWSAQILTAQRGSSFICDLKNYAGVHSQSSSLLSQLLTAAEKNPKMQETSVNSIAAG